MFSLCLDHQTNSRVSYSLIQFISDLGGFSVCLFIACTFVINAVLSLQVSLDNKIMHGVFRRRLTDSMQLGYVSVNYRQYVVATVTSLFCLRRPRNELWRKVTIRRVNRELDISRFLRK